MSLIVCFDEWGEFLVEVCQKCGNIIKQGNNFCVRCRGYHDCADCEVLDACKEQVMAGGCCFCEIPCEDDILVLALGGE